MKLIDASAVITANLYDDEHEEFLQKRTTVGELVDFCSEEGCPKAVEAIPVEWIEEYIKGFKKFAYGNGMSDMVAFQMRDIIEKWREEQK